MEQILIQQNKRKDAEILRNILKRNKENLWNKDREFSKEYKNNISLSKKGKKNGMFGKRHSENSKKKQSILRKKW